VRQIKPAQLVYYSRTYLLTYLLWHADCECGHSTKIYPDDILSHRNNSGLAIHMAALATVITLLLAHRYNCIQVSV